MKIKTLTELSEKEFEDLCIQVATSLIRQSHDGGDNIPFDQVIKTANRYFSDFAGPDQRIAGGSTSTFHRKFITWILDGKKHETNDILSLASTFDDYGREHLPSRFEDDEPTSQVRAIIEGKSPKLAVSQLAQQESQQLYHVEEEAVQDELEADRIIAQAKLDKDRADQRLKDAKKQKKDAEKIKKAIDKAIEKKDEEKINRFKDRLKRQRLGQEVSDEEDDDDDEPDDEPQPRRQKTEWSLEWANAFLSESQWDYLTTQMKCIDKDANILKQVKIGKMGKSLFSVALIDILVGFRIFRELE
jgi:hypothetical protein